MSQHPSLKINEHGDAFRSVLKRHERIKEMTEKEKWAEDKDSIYHLSKLKRLKFKVKKAPKAAAEASAEGSAAAPAADAQKKA